MDREEFEAPALLTRAEVASMFGVDAKTVTRWAKADRLSVVWTLGGHRRYLAAEVERLLTGSTPRRTDPAGDDD